MTVAAIGQGSGCVSACDPLRIKSHVGAAQGQRATDSMVASRTVSHRVPAIEYEVCFRKGFLRGDDDDGAGAAGDRGWGSSSGMAVAVVSQSISVGDPLRIERDVGICDSKACPWCVGGS